MSYLQQWDVDSGHLLRAQELRENLSALAVRDDGRFVALGTMFTGSVFVYIAFSLQVRIDPSLSVLAYTIVSAGICLKVPRAWPSFAQSAIFR